MGSYNFGTELQLLVSFSIKVSYCINLTFVQTVKKASVYC